MPDAFLCDADAGGIYRKIWRFGGRVVPDPDRVGKSVYDDYDRLVQLCDSIAGAEGVLDIEERMLDVKRRYGFYPQKKWDAHIGLRRYFEEKMGRDVYEVCEKETYDPKKC